MAIFDKQKGKIYRDLSEDQYIIQQLQNYPEWAKQKLSPDERAIFKSKATIRNFVNNSTIERRNVILAKANIQYICIYADFNNETPLHADMLGERKKGVSAFKERKAMLDAIIAGNTFITSSREVIAQAFLAAQNCHTPYYYVNMDYKKAHDAIQISSMEDNLKYFDGTTTTAKIEMMEEARTLVANLVLAVWDSDNYFRIHQHLQMIDIHILLYMFQFRNEQVSANAVYGAIYNYAKGGLRARLFTLVREGYLYGQNRNKTRSYAISEQGITVICEFLEALCRKAVIM